LTTVDLRNAARRFEEDRQQVVAVPRPGRELAEQTEHASTWRVAMHGERPQ
jgi:hypothetical protein